VSRERSKPANSARVYTRALKLFARFGVPCNTRRRRTWYDGKAIAASPKIRVLDIAHEAAHWIVSDADGRSLVNFGLGVDPAEATPIRFASQPTRPDYVDKEMLASALGLILSAQVGVQLSVVKAEAEDHCWYGEPGDFRDAVRAIEVARRTAPVDLSVGLRRLVSAYVDLNFECWRRKITPDARVAR